MYKLNISDLLEKLPDHWEVMKYEDRDSYTDGENCDLPAFIRKDKKARIYFNIGEINTDNTFGISFDIHGDGACEGNFEDAIKVADDYVETYPITWEIK
jgi:hypothetical protein